MRPKRRPKPKPDDPPPFGADGPATLAAYEMARWGARLGGVAEATPAERTLPGAA